MRYMHIETYEAEGTLCLGTRPWTRSFDGINLDGEAAGIAFSQGGTGKQGVLVRQTRDGAEGNCAGPVSRTHDRKRVRQDSEDTRL